MNHIPNIKQGYFASRSGREYLVTADRYSDGWLIIEAEEPIKHMIGKKVKRGHGFRLKTRRDPLPRPYDNKGRLINMKGRFNEESWK